MRWGVIIAAAGSGTRFGRPKQLVEIAGLPMCGWSIAAFASMPEVHAIAVVCEPADRVEMRELCRRLSAPKKIEIVAGGETRQASVAAGLARLADCDAISVHDGARPLIMPDDVRAAMHEVLPGRAATLAAPVIDTIKEVDDAGRRVVRTLAREHLWAAQTPQLAMREDFVRAHDDARLRGRVATDDVSLLEAIGIEVIVVPSSDQNFKVTYAHDLERARAILAQRTPPAMLT